MLAVQNINALCCTIVNADRPSVSDQLFYRIKRIVKLYYISQVFSLKIELTLKHESQWYYAIDFSA